MLRAIAGFRQDEAGDWVAELDCGHGQHVRDQPPFFERPWVRSAEGRSAMLGSRLDCARCDRFELPAGFEPYQRTREFDEGSIPAGLRSQHSTRRGVWGVIHVLTGRLRYVVEPPLASDRVLDADHSGVVAPEVLHRVEALGPVRFFVEFHRKGSSV